MSKKPRRQPSSPEGQLFSELKLDEDVAERYRAIARDEQEFSSMFAQLVKLRMWVLGRSPHIDATCWVGIRKRHDQLMLELAAWPAETKTHFEIKRSVLTSRDFLWWRSGWLPEMIDAALCEDLVRLRPDFPPF